MTDPKNPFSGRKFRQPTHTKHDPKKNPKPVKHKRQPICQQYLARDRMLKELGFRSWGSYLNSKLFAAIRGRATFEKPCVCCGQPSTVVYHRAYSIMNLKGETPLGLVPLCRTCLTEVTFAQNTEKDQFEQTNRRLSELIDFKTPQRIRSAEKS